MAIASAAWADEQPFSKEFTEEFCAYLPMHAVPYRKEADKYGLLYGWIDIDNDGVLEEIVPASAPGSMGGDQFDIRKPDGSLKSLDHVHETFDTDPVRWFFGTRFVPYKGKTFIVNFKEENLSHLSSIEYLIGETLYFGCQFDTKVTTALYPLVASNDKICMAVNKGQVANQSLIERTTDQKAVYKKPEQMADGFLDVDYDNDGTRDRLIHYAYDSGRGRGAHFDYYDWAGDKATMDMLAPAEKQARRRLLSAENDQLANYIDDDESHGISGPSSKWFSFENVNYLEVAAGKWDDTETRKVFRFKGKQVEKICEGTVMRQWFRVDHDGVPVNLDE